MTRQVIAPPAERAPNLITDTAGRTRVSPAALQRSHDRRRALALFLAFLSFFLLTASGHFYATDEETLYRVTESLVERHTFAVPEGLWGVTSTTGSDGRTYPVVSVLQPILAIPLYLVGKALTPFFPATDAGYLLRFTASLFNSFVAAATALLLYLFARLLAYGSRPAVALALLYSLATYAWPHNRTFFAEPLTACWLLFACYAICRGARRHQVGWLAISGLATAASLMTKPHAILALPALGLYLVGTAAFTDGNWRDWLVLARRVVRYCMIWGEGFAMGAALLAWYNYLHFGNALTTGYGGQAGTDLATPFLIGLYGLTLAGGKGLLWYAPPVLLAVAGWSTFRRRNPLEAFVCLLFVATFVGFFARFRFWHGDGSWGPRYLAMILPFALLPLLGFCELAAAPGRRSALLRAVAVVVFAAGLVVQLLGAAVNFDWYILRSSEATRHFSPAGSPILAHARILGGRIAEWSARAFPGTDVFVLQDGFSYNEAPPGSGALFPRWTTGAGAIALRPATSEPLIVKLTFFDHRPSAERTSRPTVAINGQTVGTDALEARDLTGNGEGWIYQFAVPASALHNGTALVTIQSATWNPHIAGRGERDEELGVFVHNVEVWRAGQPLRGLDAPPIAPPFDTPRWTFWWFNDDATRHHLVDHWAWYAAVIGLPRGPATGLIAGYGVAAMLPGIASLLLGLPTLPRRTRRRRRKQRRS